MSDHLSTAKASLQAEIAHTKAGLAHYASRLAALEQALAGLEGLGHEKRATMTAKAESPPGLPAKPAKAKKSNAKAKGGSALPSTGGDFWTSLLSSEPKSNIEILEGAIEKMGLALTPDQRKALANRQTFALNALVKQKKIQDSGKGRDRRYFTK
jgi:hypothetical protein